MGSQATGLGVKNPRAKCAWRNLRPSSAWTHYYLSRFRGSGCQVGCARIALVSRAQTSSLSNPPSPPNHGHLSAFLSGSAAIIPARDSQIPSRPSCLHVRGHEEPSRSTPSRLVRMNAPWPAAGGRRRRIHPSLTFPPLYSVLVLPLVILCPTYDAMSEWVVLADSFCGILPSRCPKDLTPGLLPSCPPEIGVAFGL